VVAVLAVVVLASWGWRRAIWPRAEPHQGNKESVAPASPDDVALPGAAEARPEGDALAVSRGGHLALLEVLGEAVGPEHAAGEVCVSPDATTVVAGHEDGSVAVWEVGAAPSRLMRSFAAHAGSVDALAWSPDGQRVATAGADEVVLWDPWTGRATLKLPRSRNRFFDLAFSPDGRLLYASARPEVVDVWDVASGEKKATLDGEIATGAYAGEEWEGPLAKAPIGGLPPHVIAVGPDGSWLATGDFTFPVRIIETASGHLIRCLPGFGRPVSDVVATSDGKLLTNSNKTLRIWDTRTWEEVGSFTGPNGAVAQSDDGAWAICTNRPERTLGIWKVESGALADAIEVGSKPFALAVRGRAIWVGCEDGTIKRYEHRP